MHLVHYMTDSELLEYLTISNHYLYRTRLKAKHCTHPAVQCELETLQLEHDRIMREVKLRMPNSFKAELEQLINSIA